jgi:hypothetical protein
MSTLLSDLDSSPPGPSKDGDLVDQILKEMNGPPLSPAMIPAQMPNTAVNSYSMGTNPATAHVIGGAHPTPADFAAAMHSAPQQGMAPQQVMAGGNPYAEGPPPVVQQYRPPKKSYLQRFADEFKIPLLVSIIVFVFSLPVINVLFAHYIPSMMMSTGQLTTVGLLIKSLVAGGGFWFLQRVVAPLFSI